MADLDADGDQDLFVGTRLAAEYGGPVGGAILENDGSGRFSDATKTLAPGLLSHELQTAGITDAGWGDLDGDGAQDLVVVGEWMPLTVFLTESGTLRRADPRAIGLDSTRGWWQSLTLADLNDDGSIDIVGGNHGLNSRFKARPGQPVQMWAGDFSGNGGVEHIFGVYDDDGGPYPVALRQHLIQQIPSVKNRYSSFAEYAGEPVTDMFSRRELDYANAYRAQQLASVLPSGRKATS